HFYTDDESVFFSIGTIDSDADNAAHDWGFSLVPEGSLTAEAVVGWGPGTSDLSANGSPIWVTAADPTTVYVDFDADPTTGANTDPLGNRYDIAYSLAAFESRRIYDTVNNDNDQTGAYLYTLNGVLITAAWGQDPATASPGNPYLDMGTTILPLPAVSARKDVTLFAELIQNGFVEAGETLLYTITVANDGTVVLPEVVVSDTLPVAVDYVSNTMLYNDTPLADDLVPPALTYFPLDEGGYNFGTLDPGDMFTLTFQVVVTDDITDIQVLQNQAEVDTVAGFLLSAVSTPLGGSTCVMTTTTATGAPTTVYIEEAEICLRINDQDENTDPATQQTITAEAFNLDNGDRETLILVETGVDTGIFEGCIQSSDTYGQAVDDGVLYAIAGELITARYQDPDFADDVCEPPEPLQIAAQTEAKFLYLTAPGQGLDRIDPVATHGLTTSVSIELGGGAGGVVTGTVRDEFSTNSYGNNDGTQDWEGPWLEEQDDGSATGGDAQVIGGELRLGNNNDGPFPQVTREADLSGGTVTAWFSFDFSTSDGVASDETEDEAIIEVSDGGAFQTLHTYYGGVSGATLYDISSYISADTQVRLRVAGDYSAATPEYFYVDNAEIMSSTNSSGTLRDEFGSVAYNNSDGTRDWSGNSWVESGDDDLPGSGFIQIVSTAPWGDELRIRNSGRYIRRVLDLPSNTAVAMFSFDFRDLAAEAGDDIEIVFLPDNDPADRTVLDTISGSDEPGSRVYDLSPYLATATNPAIGFWVATGFGGGEYFYISNVQIAYLEGVGGGVSTTVFTQTLPMAADFQMPSPPPPPVISATLYVSVTSGTMPGVPDIDAVLSYNDGTIITLQNPTATSLGGNLYELVWNGATTQAITVSAGSRVSLTLTTYESDLNFHILYDSETYPSRFELPAASVITLESLAVYDEAYPGGAAIPAAYAGETVYVRGQVSDPFGYYDIITATLVISDPCGGTQSFVLTDTSAVSMVGPTKIYEHPWQIPACTGPYTITLTSFEGYEGLTDRGVVLFQGDQGDTGTPSITDFITPTGELVDSYVPTSDVCVQVVDADQAGTSDTMTVTVTSGSGDSEVLALTETGPSTGVFTACITSATGAPTPGDNILDAPMGDQLHVIYSDPDDPDDTSEDDAVIKTLAPALSIGK
ncbi:MAG: DUF11 domain-containing protein, partial [Anaerolineae bacterium]